MLLIINSFLVFFHLQLISAQSLSNNGVCECNRSFNPVCATDGQTYENICKLTCEQRLRPETKLDYSGTCCPKAEFCTTYYDPVCDNFGETHDNRCKFSFKECVAKKSHNFALKIVKNGPCDTVGQKIQQHQQPLCDFFCDESDEPLCDNMGHTHKNLCKFDLTKCRRISRGLNVPEVVHVGACKNTELRDFRRQQPKTRVAPRMIFSPVPADGQKVWNYASFPTPASSVSEFPPEIDPYDFGTSHSEADSARTIEQTTVKPWKTSSPASPPSYQSSVITASLRLNTSPPSIAPIYIQPVIATTTIRPPTTSKPSTTKTPTLFSSCISCESEIDQVPICDNFNQTHPTLCRFARWNCERRMSGLEERVLVHIGACNPHSPVFTMEEEICPSKCSKQYKPVCDTSGVTHPNLCTYQMFNCQQRKLGNVNVSWLLYLKECQDTTSTVAPTSAAPKQGQQFDCPKPDCPPSSNPICDNEGTFHENECEFAHARCLAAKMGVVLRIMSEETCRSPEHCQKLNLSSCSAEYDPYCATDFNTYPNYCHFQNAQCKDNHIEILFKGECKKCLNNPCPIIDPQDPRAEDDMFLCDQNGETKSRCEFEMLRCIYEIKFGYNITQAYSGRCCPRDEACPVQNAPICDSNGKMYRNDCFFKVAQCRAEKIEQNNLLVEAKCAEGSSQIDECSKAACTNEYDPICGTDSVTYINVCHFSQSNCGSARGPAVEIEYRGACCDDKCSAKDFSPVCDNNNMTYLNLCEYGRERCLALKTKKTQTGMSILNYTPCGGLDCALSCPSIYEPVCASNGETFSSECELARAICILNKVGPTSLSLDYKGECCSNIQCDYNFDPVCADGQTFINECVFMQEACLANRKNGLNMTIEYPGQCCEYPAEEGCSNTTVVCDSQGQTHETMCEFNYKKCVVEKTETKTLAIIHAGACCQLEKCNDDKYEPICDSRGVTHQNLCHFKNSKCVFEKTSKDGSNLMLAYKDACCKSECSNVSEPICDQNNDVYKNKCVFEHAKCVLSKTAKDEEKLIATPCSRVARKSRLKLM